MAENFKNRQPTLECTPPRDVSLIPGINVYNSAAISVIIAPEAAVIRSISETWRSFKVTPEGVSKAGNSFVVDPALKDKIVNAVAQVACYENFAQAEALLSELTPNDTKRTRRSHKTMRD